jgi:flagellar hook-basal body complex protein FliE
MNLTNPLTALGASGIGNTAPPAQRQNLIESAGETFSKLFAEVNHLQLRADQKMEEFATAPEKDIHGTMIALQKAELSLRLFMQVRSKLTAAYQEVMRMQL